MSKSAGMGFPPRAMVGPAHVWAWQRAAAAYDAITNRRWPETANPLDVMLQDGEVAFLDAPMDYARFYGADVQYTRSTTLLFGSPLLLASSMAVSAIGNAAARSHARALARPQWREAQAVRAIVTDRRMLIRTIDSWLTFDHGAVAQFLPAPSYWHLIVEYHGAEPMMLSGVPSPHAAVVLQSILRGPESLVAHAAFAPFRYSRTAADGEFARNSNHAITMRGDGPAQA